MVSEAVKADLALIVQTNQTTKVDLVDAKMRTPAGASAEAAALVDAITENVAGVLKAGVRAENEMVEAEDLAGIATGSVEVVGALAEEIEAVEGSEEAIRAEALEVSNETGTIATDLVVVDSVEADLAEAEEEAIQVGTATEDLVDVTMTAEMAVVSDKHGHRTEALA